MGREGEGVMPESAARVEPLAPREWGLLALLAVAFLPALLALADVWRAVDYQSHGFLVPLVSVWVALRERYAWRRLPARSDRRGGLALAAAFAAYAVGIGIGSTPLQGLALVAAVAGAVLWTRGGAWLRRLAFPIGFLLFMVPVPDAWIGPLILRLQLFVTDASLALCRLLGVELAREGNVLILPTGEHLFVAEACSGVTSVITLAPLGVLLAYLTLRRPATRVALVAAVVPLAMLGNLARVVATVLASLRFGTALATSGPPHELLGLLTYAVAVALMLAVGQGLRRAERGR
jgi:exosortase